jgi:hypothetical protein
VAAENVSHSLISVSPLADPNIAEPAQHDRSAWPSDYDDMTIKLRRVIIAARFRGPCPEQATPQETRAVLAAWAAAGT